jgi:hypothetical protein
MKSIGEQVAFRPQNRTAPPATRSDPRVISRALHDPRVFNIFERAAEIHAQVIARGPLSGRG